MELLKCNGFKFLEFVPKEAGHLSGALKLSGSYALIQCESKLLMVYNKWRSQWELPAGRREGAETPKECAVRELSEETGQQIADLKCIGILKSENIKTGEVKHNPVFHALVDRLQPFLKNEETTAMKLWDGDEKIGVVDEVDCQLVRTLMNKNNIKEPINACKRKGRAAAILMDDHKVALIKRTWKEEVYYVFPGGGIEEGESPAEAAKREVCEELGLVIRILDCVETVEFGEIQYFFHGDIISGTFNAGKGEEFTDPYRNRGLYEPLWMEIKELDGHDVRPKKVADKIREKFGSHTKKKGE